MTATIGPCISADSHVTEPIDLYAERVDRGFRDRVPRIEVVGDWRSLLIEGLRPRKLMPASQRELAIIGDWGTGAPRAKALARSA